MHETYLRIGDLFAAVEAQIEAGLVRIGVAYEGAGSDAARSGIAVLQQWTRDAQLGSWYAGEVVAYQAEGYTTARDTMPEPVQVTAQDGFLDNLYDFFGGTTPREEQEQQAREAHVRAAQVMSTYDAHSAGAVSSMPAFVPPPPVTVEVLPQEQQPLSGGPVNQSLDGGGGLAITPPPGSPASTPGAGATGAPGGAVAPAWTGPIAPAGPGAGVPGGVPGLPPLRGTSGTGGTGGSAGRFRAGTTAGIPPGGHRPGTSGGDYGHVRRHGLNVGSFGPGGFDPDGPGGRGVRSGLDPGGHGARGNPEGVGARGRGGVGAFGGFMQPVAPGSGTDDGREHRRRYVVETDEYFADDRLVPPPVIGEPDRR